jgi:hypothetical protein
LLAIAVVSVVMMLVAVRFTWLGVFPLLLLAQAWAGGAGPSARGRGRLLLCALAAAGLLVSFFRLGDWPMISQAIPADRQRYAQPYVAGKYFAHALWVLQDAGLRGHLYGDYALSGFAGYWLAPELRVFVNGSLNVAPAVMEANRAIRAHRGVSDDQGILQLLDSYQVDLFFGTRLPIARAGSKALFYTTTDLEGAPGWIPIFRNLDSAVYLRSAERNRENLERIASWYAREGVPFDPRRGFDAREVILAAPAWAMRRGMIPVDFAALGSASAAASPARRVAARERLAFVYVALGLYEDALRMDRRILASDPENQGARRRVVWSLLHAGRDDEAFVEAEELVADPGRPLASGLKEAVAEYRAIQDVAEARAFRVRLPLFSRAEAIWLKSGVIPAEARER